MKNGANGFEVFGIVASINLISERVVDIVELGENQISESAISG